MTSSSGQGEESLATAVLSAPASEEHAGGDFHLIDRMGNRALVVVGDVEGRGEDAAPYAERASAVLREHARQAEGPAQLLDRLNSTLCDDSRFDRFATACAIVVDVGERWAEWAFAGHLPPHWLDSGMPVDGARPGLPLGVEPGWAGTTAGKRPLQPGAGFVVFSDGLEDARDANGHRFGASRVTHILATELQGCSPDAVVRRLKEAVCTWAGGDLDDDLCLAALRVH